MSDIDATQMQLNGMRHGPLKHLQQTTQQSHETMSHRVQVSKATNQHQRTKQLDLNPGNLAS